MMTLVEDKKVVELNWVLAKDLFIKWGYDADKASECSHIDVKDIDKILIELSAWGVPWKRIKWGC